MRVYQSVLAQLTDAKQVVEAVRTDVPLQALGSGAGPRRVREVIGEALCDAQTVEIHRLKWQAGRGSSTRGHPAATAAPQVLAGVSSLG